MNITVQMTFAMPTDGTGKEFRAFKEETHLSWWPGLTGINTVSFQKTKIDDDPLSTFGKLSADLDHPKARSFARTIVSNMFEMFNDKTKRQCTSFFFDMFNGSKTDFNKDAKKKLSSTTYCNDLPIENATFF